MVIHRTTYSVMYFYITHRLKYKMIEEEKDMWWLLILHNLLSMQLTSCSREMIEEEKEMWWLFIASQYTMYMHFYITHLLE